MFAKQWFHEYLAYETQDPLHQLCIHFFRNQARSDWLVYETTATLPLLLQTSLALFFIGLGLYLRELNSTVCWVTVGVMIAGLAAVGFQLIAPVFTSHCPYKIPKVHRFSSMVRPYPAVPPLSPFRPALDALGPPEGKTIQFTKVYRKSPEILGYIWHPCTGCHTSMHLEGRFHSRWQHIGYCDSPPDGSPSTWYTDERNYWWDIGAINAHLYLSHE